MALVSLILGIVSFFCLWGIGGILAIVFGILGMGKAKQMNGTGKGMSIAGLILGVINIVGTVLFIIIVAVAGNKASNEISSWTGKADPSQYSYTIDSCEVDSLGYPSMMLTVKNSTSKSKSWTFDYEFRTASGSVIDSGTTLPESVPGNDSVLVDIAGFTKASKGSVKCSITGVNNWFN